MTQAERAKRWRENNRERYNANARRWAKQNRKKVNAFKRRCYANRRNYYILSARLYRVKNRKREAGIAKGRIDSLAEKYVRQLLRKAGNRNPSTEEISRKRTQVLALRTQRIFKLMLYAGTRK